MTIKYVESNPDFVPEILMSTVMPELESIHLDIIEFSILLDFIKFKTKLKKLQVMECFCKVDCNEFFAKLRLLEKLDIWPEMLGENPNFWKSLYQIKSIKPSTPQNLLSLKSLSLRAIAITSTDLANVLARMPKLTKLGLLSLDVICTCNKASLYLKSFFRRDQICKSCVKSFVDKLCQHGPKSLILGEMHIKTFKPSFSFL